MLCLAWIATSFVTDSSFECPLQKFQVASDLINDSPGRRSNAQHSRATTGDLRSAGIVDDVCDHPKAHGLCLQYLQLLLALDLQCHLGLAHSFPSLQDGRFRSVSQEVFVACQCCVTTLCTNLACRSISI